MTERAKYMVDDCVCGRVFAVGRRREESYKEVVVDSQQRAGWFRVLTLGQESGWPFEISSQKKSL